MKNEKQEYFKVAVLVAISCVLQISESLIPNPIPGLKLGLANIITLIVLFRMGFKYALEIAIFRTVLSSFIMGTFLSPAFILSLSGAVGSTFVMGSLLWLSRNTVFKTGIIVISIIGALVHNIVQLYTAYGILLHHRGIFMFLPWLCTGSVIMGWLTGTVSQNVCRNLRDIEERKFYGSDDLTAQGMISSQIFYSSNSFLHRMKGELKLSGMFLIAVSILFFKKWLIIGFFYLLIISLIYFSGLSYRNILKKMYRYASLLIFSFLLPVFFNSGTHSLFYIASFNITFEGIETGLYFAGQISLLIMLSIVLGMTTSGEELTRSFAVFMSPLKYFGVSDKRISGILSISIILIPVFLEITGKIINTSAIKNVKSLRNFIPALSNVIEKVYLESERKRNYDFVQ